MSKSLAWAGLALLCGAADRAVKWIALVADPGDSAGFFVLHLNRRGIFSWPIANEVLVAVGVVTLAAIAWRLMRQRTADTVRMFYVALFLVGGASNVFDRLVYGGVVDVFRVGELIFNLADTYLMISVAGFAYLGFLKPLAPSRS